MKIKIDGFRCMKCGHEWVARNREHEPEVCPKCKSPYFNRPILKGSRAKASAEVSA